LNLHCIGDSHCCFFLGYDRISQEYPAVEKSLLSRVYTYRLGASLAYNLNKYGTTSRGREMMEQILSGLDPQSDVLLLSFGEVDCRAHLLKQAQKQGISHEQVVDDCLNNYMQAIREIRKRGFRVLIWNAVHSANFLEKGNFEFPYFGTVQDRNTITRIFNAGLKKRAAHEGYTFIDISDHLIDESTLLTRDEFYHDAIHLNRKLFLQTMRMINERTGVNMFSYTDLATYKVRFALHSAFKSMKHGFASIKKKLRSALKLAIVLPMTTLKS